MYKSESEFKILVPKETPIEKEKHDMPIAVGGKVQLYFIHN